MRRKQKFGIGICAIMFAVGLICSCFCPPRLIIAVLAIWVIILGLSYPKC